MKIAVKTVKPRNPYVALARQRRGNAHGSYRPERSSRRIAKRDLQRMLKTNFEKGE